MKFVYCGYDFMLGLVHRLVQAGHTPVGILTFPCDNVFNFNAQTVRLAHDMDIPIHIEKPLPETVDFFRGQGAEVFISAGYLYKIPTVAPAYGLNIHPSLLPKGRGLMPLPYILLDNPEAAGFTIHKLAPEFDAGDILYQESLPLGPRETVETLSARIAGRAPEALADIMKDLPGYWQRATPQDEARAVHFPPPTERMCLLDWDLPLERLDKIARAFGHFGCLADFGGGIWAVFAHATEVLDQAHQPGTVLSAENGEIRIAAKGGVFIVKKCERLK